MSITLHTDLSATNAHSFWYWRKHSVSDMYLDSQLRGAVLFAAVLFLLVYFNTIHMAVKNKIPWKYE